MEFEVLVDSDAVRRERRRTILALIAFALVPVAILMRYPLASVLGREVAGRCAWWTCIAAFVGFMSFPLWRLGDSNFYRCPRCGRRVPKVAPRGQHEPNVHFACADCRVIWDLGWAWHGGGEGGGG